MKHYLIYTLFFVCIFTLADQKPPDTLKWDAPTQRENGEPLELEDIGGYEIIGYDSNGVRIWAHISEDGKLKMLRVQEALLIGVSTFKIAVYDVNGLYSEFVDITPKDGRREAPTDGSLIYSY